jgi:transcriptional regulator GlxA family with amidase domain
MDLRTIQAAKTVQRTPSPKLSLHALARKVGLSERRVRTLFKFHTGMTFVSFWRDLRMRRAQKLLAKTAKPIKEISFTLGYATDVSFCRDFKSVAGCTPTRYRSRFRNR